MLAKEAVIMFKDIESLVQEIEHFKSNIAGSEVMIRALKDASDKFEIQAKKTEMILKEFEIIRSSQAKFFIWLKIAVSVSIIALIVSLINLFI